MNVGWVVALIGVVTCTMFGCTGKKSAQNQSIINSLLPSFSNQDDETSAEAISKVKVEIQAMDSQMNLSSEDLTILDSNSLLESQEKESLKSLVQ